MNADVNTNLAPRLGIVSPTGRLPKVLMPKTYRVDEISHRHHEIARMVLLGVKNNEIARRLNITREFVSNVRNSPVVKEQLDLMAAERDKETIDVAIKIKEALPKCVDFLAETIEDGEVSKTLRSKNAFGLLSIGGHGTTKNVSVKATHAILTATDIAEIRDRGISLANEIGILDVKEEDIIVEKEQAE